VGEVVWVWVSVCGCGHVVSVHSPPSALHVLLYNKALH